MSPLLGRGVPAGLDSHRQGSGSWAGISLKAAEDHKRLSLRSSGSPFSRPLRFSSPSADGSRNRIPPGATSSIPGSPRASPRSSPRGSDRGLRGMSPGRMVESFRSGMMWPHVRGTALLSGVDEIPRDTSVDIARQEFHTPASDRVAALHLPSYRTSNAMDRSIIEVTALPAAEILAAHTLPKECDEEFVISTAEANCLATLAAAEAESEATRLHPEALPPSPEPLYRDNPWRLGLTARSKERGASRIFPCFLMTPHAVATGRSNPSNPQTLGREDSVEATRIIPPEGACLEPPYPRMLPSSTGSVSSVLDLPEDGPMVLIDDYKDSQGSLPVSVPTNNTMSADSGSHPQETPEEFPRALTRTSRSIRPGSVATAGYPSVQETRSLHSAKKSPLSATRDARNGGPSITARLTALRGRLEKNLKSAEEGLDNDLRQLDKKLAGARA